MISITFFLLRKGIYPYKCMDNWEKFNETSLLEKEEFYSNLNMEDIKDADYMQAKRVCKEIKNLVDYNDYNNDYNNDTLLLAIFENFRKMYHLDPAKFI